MADPEETETIRGENMKLTAKIKITDAEILKRCRENRDRTALCGEETYYPAVWTYGKDVGVASSSRRGDCGANLAREATVKELCREISDEMDAAMIGADDEETEQIGEAARIAKEKIRKVAETWRSED